MVMKMVSMCGFTLPYSNLVCIDALVWFCGSWHFRAHYKPILKIALNAMREVGTLM